MSDTGVLLVRDDGVIDVPQALPWPTALAAQIVRTVAALAGPADDEPQQTEEER
jgi:hypothetical protein